MDFNMPDLNPFTHFQDGLPTSCRQVPSPTASIKALCGIEILATIQTPHLRQGVCTHHLRPLLSLEAAQVRCDCRHPRTNLCTTHPKAHENHFALQGCCSEWLHSGGWKIGGRRR